MAEEIAFANGRISNFQGLVTLTLNRVGHAAYRRASLIDLYLHAKFHWNRRNVFVDGRTDGRTDISDRLYQVDSDEST